MASLVIFAAAEAWATNVYVTSIAPTQVQVIVNGSTLRSLRIGDTTPEGVRLLEVRGGAAVLEVDGRQVALGLGQATQVQTTLQADRRGHFITTALLNGVSVPALIDTGASVVVMNTQHAQRLGFDYRRGQRTVGHTANGPVTAYVVTLASVQIGDVTVRNVQAMIQEANDAFLPEVLIGMSFLQHVDMRRSGAVMTLTRPSLQ